MSAVQVAYCCRQGFTPLLLIEPMLDHSCQRLRLHLGIVETFWKAISNGSASGKACTSRASIADGEIGLSMETNGARRRQCRRLLYRPHRTR